MGNYLKSGHRHISMFVWVYIYHFNVSEGKVQWSDPLISHDLTALDVFLWEHLKSKVRASKYANLEELK